MKGCHKLHGGHLEPDKGLWSQLRVLWSFGYIIGRMTTVAKAPLAFLSFQFCDKPRQPGQRTLKKIDITLLMRFRGKKEPWSPGDRIRQRPMRPCLVLLLESVGEPDTMRPCLLSLLAVRLKCFQGHISTQNQCNSGLLN